MHYVNNEAHNVPVFTRQIATFHDLICMSLPRSFPHLRLHFFHTRAAHRTTPLPTSICAVSTSHYSLLCCTVRARTMSSHQPFSNTRPLLTTHDRDYLSCSISPLLRGRHHTNSGTCNDHWTVTDTVTSNHYTFRIPFLPLELEISIDYLHSHLTISLHIMSTNLTQPDRIHFSLAANHYGFLTDYLTISLFTWHCTTIQDTFS